MTLRRRACVPWQVSSIAHAVCFGFSQFSSFLHVVIHALLQFVGSGCIIATLFWYLENKYLTVHSPHRWELLPPPPPHQSRVPARSSVTVIALQCTC